MIDRVLVFGNGWVGNKFAERLPDAEVTAVDITDRQAVRAELARRSPAVAINAAGKTGKPNIDWCEEHKLETLASNTTGPLVLARECLDRGVFFVHVGSGCVYDGDNGGKGYSEDDPPNYFGSFYSRTKIFSEQALRELPVLQLRLRMPIDSVPGPRNLITKLVGYRKVISIPNSVSVLDDFFAASLELIRRRRTGVYNMTNPGAIVHPQILTLYREIVDPAYSFEILGELGGRVKTGRSNCLLSTAKLDAEGLRMRPVEEAVRATLVQYRFNKNHR